MDKLEILVICSHAEILQTVVRLVNNNPEWHATGVITDEDALSAFNQTPFKLVLLGSGIEKESETALCTAPEFRTGTPNFRSRRGCLDIFVPDSGSKYALSSRYLAD
jgi:PleD family two-component response regulator